MSDSLQPHGLQHVRAPFPSQTPGVCSVISIKSVLSSNHLILCHSYLLPSIFPSTGVFFNESVLCIRRPKYWSFSFSISSSNEYSGLPEFPLGLTGWISLKSKEHSRVFSNTTFKRINSLVLGFLCRPTVTSIHDYWENHRYD